MYTRDDVIGHAAEVWTEEVEALENAKDIISELVSPETDTPQADLIFTRSIVHSFDYEYESMSLIYGSPVAKIIAATWHDIGDTNEMLGDDNGPVIDDRNRRTTQLINEVLLPITVTGSFQDNSAPVEGRSIIANSGYCASAEIHFNSAREQGKTGRGTEHSKVSVYHNENGQPIILRKENVESTGLTLEPIALGEVIIPAGTIVGVDPKMSDNSVSTRSKQLAASKQYTYEIKGPISIAPNRLSPWAYKGLDALNYAILGRPSDPGYDSARHEMLETTTLDDFRRAAHKIMERCGVQTSDLEAEAAKGITQTVPVAC